MSKGTRRDRHPSREQVRDLLALESLAFAPLSAALGLGAAVRPSDYASERAGAART
jgi:hypothetical protein